VARSVSRGLVARPCAAVRANHAVTSPRATRAAVFAKASCRVRKRAPPNQSRKPEEMPLFVELRGRIIGGERMTMGGGARLLP